jgi:hypothetical protein
LSLIFAEFEIDGCSLGIIFGGRAPAGAVVYQSALDPGV